MFDQLVQLFRQIEITSEEEGGEVDEVVVAVPSTDSGAGAVEIAELAVEDCEDQVGCEDGEVDVPPGET